MSEYIPGSMTDEQALEILKSMKLTIGRGSAKTMFQQGLLEAMWHAEKALEEKVKNKGEWKLHGMIYYCSKCGHDYEQGGNNFCGNCGADMRGEEE